MGLLCWLPAAPAHAAQPDEEWQRRATTYFTLYYTPTDAETAERYAALVDELYEYVATIFDHGPTTPVALRLYPDAETYATANPIARFQEGVVAHADVRRGEIGVAVDRLARAGPEVTRDTIRHELMHLIGTELTADRLPIGFQEGLAQYAEREASDRRKLVQSLESAHSQGRLLTWDALSDYRRFMLRLNVAYPQALSVVSFLADRYGLGAFKRFLGELRSGDTPYREALEAAYGRPAGDLEAEWRAYLPAYFAGRWEINLLRSLDLADARARFAAGEYSEARPLFEEARRLYADLEQPARLAEADGYLERIVLALAAGELATRGRAHLAGREYAQARDLLAEADRRYAEAGDERWRPSLAAPLAEAERGAVATERLAVAEALVAGWRYPEGRERSAEAAALYLGLGDTAGLQRAQALQAEAEGGQRRLALILLSAGGLVLTGLGVSRGRRRGPPPLRRATEEGIAL